MNDKKTVFLVDDNRIQSQMLQEWLRSNRGYNILLAFDGEEALKILRSGVAIDLMVLDVKMPKIDGLTLCRILNEEYWYIVRIIMTGYANDVMIAKAKLEYGAVDVIRKPCAPAVIGEIIDKVLGLSKEIRKDDGILIPEATEFYRSGDYARI
jgi:CheY-like chemotaxis protein